MKKEHTFTLPHKKIAKCVLIIFIISLFAVGCSSGNKEPISSSDNPELKCESINDFSSDSKFWSWAYDNIPTVSIPEISSGKYDESYVCIDAWIIGVVENNGWYEIPIVAEISPEEYSRMLYTPGIDNLSIPKYGEKVLKDFERNEKIKFCIFVENGSYTLDHAIAVKNLGRDTSFDVDAFLKEENEQNEQKKKEQEALAQAAKDAITNPLMKEELKTGTVYSGDKSQTLGSYGYISITKESLKSVTEEEFEEFAQEKVKDNPWYNWISIICEDGTGITFSGCNIYYPTYGKLDTDGSILEGYGDIIWDFENETYSYTSRQ